MEEKETKIIETEEQKKEIQKSNEEVAREMGLVLPKNMADQINNTMAKYIEQGLEVPKDYNVQNAVISSYLIIQQDNNLNNCEKTSIASALIKMATLGLNVSKQQGYFIPYGGKLNFQPSYFGKITAIKRINGVKDVIADVIYKDTEYELICDEYGNDDIKIIKPCPLDKRSFENLVGAWSKIVLDENVWNRKSHTCVMTKDQIQKAWNQGQMKGNSPAHKNFMDEMMKKSVINRCCKNFVNSAIDQDIYIQTLNETIANDYEEPQVVGGKIIKEAEVIDI